MTDWLVTFEKTYFSISDAKFAMRFPARVPRLSNGIKRLQMRIYNTHRLELSNVGIVRAHVPISRRSLVRKLLEKFPYFHHKQLLELFSSVDAVIQSQSRPFSLLLKDLYDPLNPDKDTVSIRNNFDLEQQQSELMDHMRPLLGC